MGQTNEFFYQKTKLWKMHEFLAQPETTNLKLKTIKHTLARILTLCFHQSRTA